MNSISSNCYRNILATQERFSKPEAAEATAVRAAMVRTMNCILIDEVVGLRIG